MRMILGQVSRDKWPRFNADPARFAVWANPRFLVQCFTEKGGVIRLTINRRDTVRSGQWAEGISWDELQAIKAACGYGSRDAVEVYPPDDDVVNISNMRHLWIFPEGERLPFVWRNPKAGQQLSLVKDLLAKHKEKGE